MVGLVDVERTALRGQSGRTPARTCARNRKKHLESPGREPHRLFMAEYRRASGDKSLPTEPLHSLTDTTKVGFGSEADVSAGHEVCSASLSGSREACFRSWSNHKCLRSLGGRRASADLVATRIEGVHVVQVDVNDASLICGAVDNGGHECSLQVGRYDRLNFDCASPYAATPMTQIMKKPPPK